MVKKSKLHIKCPKCRMQGIIKLKNKNQNSIIVSHYNSKNYKLKKGKLIRNCYIGTTKNMEAKIEQIMSKNNVQFTENQKMELRNNIKKFVRLVKKERSEKDQQQDNKITNTEVTEIVTILDELRRIRKITNMKIEENVFRWNNLTCPKCRERLDTLKINIKGIQVSQHPELYFNT